MGRSSGRPGIRRRAAKGLTVGNLIRNPERPGIKLPAALVKRPEDDLYVPLRTDLVAHLRHEPEGFRPGDLVFAIPADTLRRFKGDCTRAGIPFLDERGRKVDIHALRTSFITGRFKAGIHPKIVQELARHSDISITMEHYTDIRVTDLHAAGEAGFAPALAFVTSSAAAARGLPLHQPLHELVALWCNRRHLLTMRPLGLIRRKCLFYRQKGIFHRSWGSRIRT